MIKQVIAKCSAILISLALVIFLLLQINVNSVISFLSNINPLFFIIGFFCYVLCYIIEAFRLHILLMRKIDVPDLFKIECIHTFVNKMLPARTGEVSYIYLIKEIHQKKVSDGIATLFTARIFDVVVLSIFLVISLNLLKGLPGMINRISSLLEGILVCIIIIIILLLYFKENFVKILSRIIEIFHLQKIRFAQYLMEITNETVNSYKQIETSRIFLTTLVTTICAWLVMFCLYALLLNIFGIQLKFSETIIIVIIIAFLPLLPIYMFGGFGTTELTTTGIMVAFGIRSDQAIIASFGTHILIVLYCSVLGIYGVHALKIPNFRVLN